MQKKERCIDLGNEHNTPEEIEKAKQQLFDSIPEMLSGELELSVWDPKTKQIVWLNPRVSKLTDLHDKSVLSSEEIKLRCLKIATELHGADTIIECAQSLYDFVVG